MSAVVEHEPASAPRVVEDVVCTACGCVCDDIELQLERDRIIGARNACAMGTARFLAYRPEPGPACLVEGRPATFADGVERAAHILADARYPLIFGLADTTSEAQRVAVSLADWVGACVDSTILEAHGAMTAALQSVGQVTSTLGEVRNRADLVIVWRADPIESHPRLFSRYALDPRGNFLPGGRGDRYCAIVDVRESASVREAADEFICIKQDGESDALWTLRALTRGIELDPSAVETATGTPLAIWQGLTDRMIGAKYGVLFYGAEPLGTRRRLAIPHAIHLLVRDLNERTRFVCMPLRGGGNLVGALNVMAWCTGYPAAVSLAGGYPRHGPGEFHADGLLGSGQADAALIVSDDPTSRLTAEAKEHLERIPRIVLCSEASGASRDATVLFRTAVFGINTDGTVYRMDAVPLPTRAVLASSFPSEEGVLRAIERRVRSLGAADRDARTEGE
jgi:formylmethanofuran dehydrogenase subunit B